MRDVYFIVVNYNGADLTRAYIESVARLDPSPFRASVTVVDNASAPGDREKLARACAGRENVRVVWNGSNLGYFRALNVGLAAAGRPGRGADGPLFVVGNNDLAFRGDFLAALAGIRYDESTLVLAPDVVTADGFHQNPHCRSRLSPLRKLGLRLYFLNYHLGKTLYWLRRRFNTYGGEKGQDYRTAQNIHMGIGACYVLTEHFFRECDRLDDRVFLYGEEALLAHQVRSRGGKILYHPAIVVFHAESRTVSHFPAREIYEISRESYKIYAPYL